MSISSVKSAVQGASNKFYELGGKHIAGQHSFTSGELVVLGIMAVAIFCLTFGVKCL